MKGWILFSVMALCSVSALGQETPNFAKFPEGVVKATVKQVNLSSHPRAKTFRAVLNNGLTGGVNFAGHFIIATWGCGSGCMQSAIIDGNTGNVFFPGALEGATLGYGELTNREPLEFKNDSRLLILNGVPGGKETGYGTRYYEWTGQTLKLVKYEKKSGSATP